jgi:hypothetical protein
MQTAPIMQTGPDMSPQTTAAPAVWRRPSEMGRDQRS